MGAPANAFTPGIESNIATLFGEATREVLQTQCDLKVVADSPIPMRSWVRPPAELVAVIGISAREFQGTVALCFPQNTFLKVMGKMFGEEYQEVPPELIDGAGELLNMIYGFAKKLLNENGYSVQPAIPSIVKGQALEILSPAAAATVMVTFRSECGPFHLELAVS